jgi:hypothetical protein
MIERILVGTGGTVAIVSWMVGRYFGKRSAK